ncbi:hypothetical protein [Flavobacterium sp. KACC 22763]|uniref:hypothetical protein n=1 Tax=Flavobacterium sp. KACC 22763 TaxID=3025668 RepID=UPI0023658434|nr:hypothetical protein [Flavobacterium sp. KACC 22763]WDF64774.1 hypothetical protein PQ463_01200 [Flavobacterium sp. KACC 22763]
MESDNKKSFLYRFFKTSKISRVSTFLLLISYLLAIIIFADVFDFKELTLTADLLIKIIAGLSFIVAIAVFTFSYLEGNNKKNEINDNIQVHNEHGYNESDLSRIIEQFNVVLKSERREQRENFETLLNRINEKPTIEFDLEDRDEIFKELKESISKNINKDFYDELNLNISKEVSFEKKAQFKDIIYSTRSIKDRLIREIEKLDRKSNINLIVGSGMTIVALFCLGFIVFEKHDNIKTTEEILLHYIPRISFIIFIEVFAFFFLRLYKLNLNDIKYYQNELTNIDLKSTSLISSINFGVKEDVTSVIAEFSKTERNFVIEKGQSTIELEKFKFEQNSIEKASKIIKNIIRK